MQKTKRKVTRRKLLSVMLSVALLVTMLPLSGGQKAKAAGYPVTYEVKTDSEGNEYISLTGMADNYVDFIDSEGTLTLPDEIEGKPVKEVGEYVLLEISQGKKVVVPASIDTFLDSAAVYMPEGSTVEEVYIMCQSILTIKHVYGVVCWDAQCDLDIYYYPPDYSGKAASILPDEGMFMDANVTMHVSSQTMIDKFNADADFKKLISNGNLTLVKDLEVSGDNAIAAKRQALAQKVAQGEGMMPEGNYTKASWAVLQVAIAEGKKQAESSDGDVLDAAIAALDAAITGMVSVADLNKAIAEAEALNQEEYWTSSWASFQAALNAAKAVPDDATAEKVEELRSALVTAQKAMKKKTVRKLTIAWEGSDSGPAVPPVKANWAGGGGTVTYHYYQDEACGTPAAGQDNTAKPTTPGTYYVRATLSADDMYAAATSNVLQFTITERQVNWNGYQWDAGTGELAITEDMPDFPNIMEVPWYEDMGRITAVKVADGVTLTKISAYAFQGAGNLQTFQIPATVKEVGESAFEDCRKLEATIALTGVTLGEKAFDSCDKLQGSVALADAMTEVPAGCFANSGIQSVTIPEGVTAIREDAFRVAQALGKEGFALPSTVRTIEANAFAYTGLASIALPEGLETIGESAFERCPSLEGIALPASLRELGKGAFKDSGLKQIIIPATVQTIGGGLFLGCKSLSYVEFKGTGYDTEALKTEGGSYEGKQFDTMFQGTSPDIAVMCDGTTYDTLASYAGTVPTSNGNINGWPASILHKTEEYLADTQAAYQAEKQALAGLQREDYTEATWNSLQEAIAAAEALLAEDGSTREVIAGRQAAQKKLAEGASACLREIIGGTKAFLAGENIEKDYDTESDSWYALQDAIEDAERTLQDGGASAAQILGRLRDIQEAKKNLAPRNPQPGTSATPSTRPSADPSAKPSADPSAKPSADPGAKPSADPGSKPSTGPSAKPSTQPSAKPSTGPNVSPSTKPSPKPQAPKVKKATVKKAKSAKKKTITVQWKKLSGVTGYQVQAALDKKFKKGKKTYTVKKAKTTKKTIKKLKSKKKYYVRVRAYKTVKGKKYYGSWSKAKKVKVR